MIDQINYNGTILPEGTAIFSSRNRAFRYGDGLFESIRMLGGKMPLLLWHYERLIATLHHLKFDVPSAYSQDFFESEIKKITGRHLNVRIRLTIFRKEGGLYLPENSMPEYLIEAVTFQNNSFALNSEGLKAAFADQASSPGRLSNLKTNNCLPYILGKMEAREKGVDELILFNNEGGIMEGTSSNIFMYKDKKLVTPPLSEGCLDGVMRAFILQHANQMNLTIEVSPIPLNMLTEATEVWLTNAIQGIQWIGKIENRTFGSEKAIQVIQSLNRLITNR